MSKNFDRYYIEYNKEKEIKIDEIKEENVEKIDDIILDYRNEYNYNELIKDKEIWNFNIFKTNKIEIYLIQDYLVNKKSVLYIPTLKLSRYIMDKKNISCKFNKTFMKWEIVN